MPSMIRDGVHSVPPPPTCAVSGGSVFCGEWGLFPHNLLLERDAVVGGDTHDVDACGEA
jgi:hypothetical protein